MHVLKTERKWNTIHGLLLKYYRLRIPYCLKFYLKMIRVIIVIISAATLCSALHVKRLSITGQLDGKKNLSTWQG